ncbi:MAG: alpha/beta fold hydrolase [Planctomycetota bacterium]|nr:alpha/beta fold hydrolase [Planctomycetota bacterium]
MFASIRGTRIYFDVDGMGLVPAPASPGVPARMVERPVLFLVHGGPGGDHSNFKFNLAELRDTVQLVYIDHRGSGRSQPADPSTYTLDHNIDDLDALRTHLGLQRISILGSSYGGMVAQGYALRYPDRVANLILSATAPSHRTFDEARRILQERGTPEQRAQFDRVMSGGLESLAHVHEYFRVMGPLYAVAFDLRKWEENLPRLTFTPAQFNLSFAPNGFLRSFDYLDQLHKIMCPTLVLAGRHDWICPVSQSEEIAKRIPRAHLKVFPNAAHMIASDEREAYLAAVRGFMTCAAV